METGAHPVSGEGFQTPDEAEQAYYRALEESDLDAMMNVWAEDEDVVCVHPARGVQLQGPKAVLEGWINVFSREFDAHITLQNVRRMQSGDLAIHIGQEAIVRRSDPSAHGVINFTNVYRRTDHGWKMIAHHASSGPEVDRSREQSIFGLPQEQGGENVH